MKRSSVRASSRSRPGSRSTGLRGALAGGDLRRRGRRRPARLRDARAGRGGQLALRERRRSVAPALRDALRAEGRAQERDHDAIARPVPEPRRDAEPPRRGAARVHGGGAREPLDPFAADAAGRLRALRRPGVAGGGSGARGPVPLHQDLQRPGDRRPGRDDPLRPRPDRASTRRSCRRTATGTSTPAYHLDQSAYVSYFKRDLVEPDTAGSRDDGRRRRGRCHRRRHGRRSADAERLGRDRAPHVPARPGRRRRVLAVPRRDGAARPRRAS